MNKLTVAFIAGAFVFGSTSAQAEDSAKKAPDEDAAAKSLPAPKKDWPTKKEKQEATAAAARERATKEQNPLVGDFGTPGVRAADRSKVAPKALPKEKANPAPPKAEAKDSAGKSVPAN